MRIHQAHQAYSAARRRVNGAHRFILPWQKVHRGEILQRYRHPAIMTANVNRTGVQAHKTSTMSLRAGGAMAMLYCQVNFDLIRILGRWHSNAMIWYLHIQAQPVMQKFASTMFNNGTYKFLPDEMVPVNNFDHDEL
jgi:hypothetical protein